MPTYHVDLTSDRGDFQRIPFTLDDDRPLGPQLRHVLEELRGRGTVLRGGPEDELAVTWSGQLLDPNRTLQQLGVAPHHPIVLAMRRRERARPARTEPPATPFLSRGAYLGGLSGFTGAAVAWITATFALSDLPPFLTSYGALDLAVATLLGGLSGGMILGIEERGRHGSFLLGAFTGTFVGAAGAVAGCLLGGLLGGPLGMATSTLGFRLTRIAAWVLMVALCGFALGAARYPVDGRRMWDGLAIGAASGALGGLLMLLPGPTDLWQMLSFALVGTALGYGLLGLSLRRALGVLELEAQGDVTPGLLGHRWWGVHDNSTTHVGQRFAVRSAAGACRLVPAVEGIQVAGEAAAGETPLLNMDAVTSGATRFRFRRHVAHSL